MIVNGDQNGKQNHVEGNNGGSNMISLRNTSGRSGLPECGDSGSLKNNVDVTTVIR